LKFSPQYTHRKTGGGRVIAPPADMDQTTWHPVDFRLRIDGLDSATVRVSKVDAFTVKPKVVEHPEGEQRDYMKEPTSVETPNLVITFPDSASKEFYDWHEDFVIKGNNEQDKEKSATLEFLSPNRKGPLLTLNFKGLGIFKCAPEEVTEDPCCKEAKPKDATEKIGTSQAEMYCQALKFEYDGSKG
jgi:hypothetical protein